MSKFSGRKNVFCAILEIGEIYYFSGCGCCGDICGHTDSATMFGPSFYRMLCLRMRTPRRILVWLKYIVACNSKLLTR
jgi:hypothetical protein